MTIGCSKVQQHTISSNGLTDMRLIQKQSQKMSSFEIFVSYINGYDQSEQGCSKSKYLLAMKELKQYISSNNLQGLSWSKILLHWSKADLPEFPFEDNEWLGLLQVYNEEMALKRLLQFTYQNLK